MGTPLAVLCPLLFFLGGVHKTENVVCRFGCPAPVCLFVCLFGGSFAVGLGTD